MTELTSRSSGGPGNCIQGANGEARMERHLLKVDRFDEFELHGLEAFHGEHA